MDQDIDMEDRRDDERRGPDRRSSVIKTYDEKSYVFREHETAQEAFIVKSGKVRIIKTLYEDGVSKEVTLNILDEGEMFGEMALIDDKPRMASAQAYQGSLTVYVISQSQFKSMLSKSNPFVIKLLGILANLVRENSHGANIDQSNV